MPWPLQFPNCFRKHSIAPYSLLNGLKLDSGCSFGRHHEIQRMEQFLPERNDSPIQLKFDGAGALLCTALWRNLGVNQMRVVRVDHSRQSLSAGQNFCRPKLWKRAVDGLASASQSTDADGDALRYRWALRAEMFGSPGG